ncbi:MAG: hypothetical protein ACRD4O_07275, partial [Bryobacteraceae bacterium]
MANIGGSTRNANFCLKCILPRAVGDHRFDMCEIVRQDERLDFRNGQRLRLWFDAEDLKLPGIAMASVGFEIPIPGAHLA